MREGEQVAFTYDVLFRVRYTACGQIPRPAKRPSCTCTDGSH